MELKPVHREPSARTIRSLNRTNVELKLGADVRERGRGGGLNRTNVELKPELNTATYGAHVRLNRTNVELKPGPWGAIAAGAGGLESNQCGIETRKNS